MAQVNSLVCWGGRLGKTVSISATTDVVTLTNHGNRVGSKRWPSGTLPAELNVLTPVYTRPTGQNTFTLHPTETDAIANTNQILFAGSSTYSSVILKSDLIVTSSRLSDFGVDISRYGTAGSERIYDGVTNWNSTRLSVASPYDIEVCEIGEGFSDIITAVFEVTVPSARNIITTEIGADFEKGISGTRTTGFHFGKFPNTTIDSMTIDDGYIVYNSSITSGSLFKMTRYRDTLDGISIMNNISASTTASDLGTQCRMYNCQLLNVGASLVGTGTQLRFALAEAVNCLFYRWSTGAAFGSSQSGLFFVNNTLVKNNAAFSSTSTVRGFYYNNISIGNTTNWPTVPTSCEGASNNAGLSGEAWITGSGVRFTIATTDFSNYASNNFKAASSSSPQVENGIAPYGAPVIDISGHVRPDYMGGSPAYYDIGCFEFDHGNGPWPATSNISITGIITGSRVLITKDSDNSVIYNDVPGTSLNLSTSFIGDFNVVIRKASSSPFYKEFLASGTTVADQTTTIRCLQQLDE